MYDLMCLAKGLPAPPSCGLSLFRVLQASALGRAVNVGPPGPRPFLKQHWQQLCGGVQSPLKVAVEGQGAGASSLRPPSRLPGAGTRMWPSTSPPPSVAEPHRGLKVKGPPLALDPLLCLPRAGHQSVSGTRPGPLPAPAQSCENVFTGVYFLLETSFLGMSVDWFVLKRINCVRKACGFREAATQGEARRARALPLPQRQSPDTQAITWNDTFIWH